MKASDMWQQTAQFLRRKISDRIITEIVRKRVQN